MNRHHLLRAMLLTSLAATPATAIGAEPTPLKEAKLNIEYNATDEDIGFQGFVDGEGWQSLVVSGPEGDVLKFEGLGALATHGLTELFFETVEPAVADMPLEEVLAVLPEGSYTFAGPAMEAGESLGQTAGMAWLTHDIPAGPELTAPEEDADVPVSDLTLSWEPVTRMIDGSPAEIVAYQLIVERDAEPHPHMIGEFSLSIYLSPTTTSMVVPKGFLEAGTAYGWEVLAIEASGNQTLSSSTFRTR
jgi:hypothetical protein